MQRPYFELNFRPNFALVTVVRRFVSEFNQRFLDEPDSARVALATHELLENAVKFSADGGTTIRMEIVDTPERDKRVRVILRNRAEAGNIDAVKRLLAGLTDAASPFGFYQQLLVKRAKIRDGSGGLGLARICAEAEMDVVCNVDGDIITIEASSMIENGGARA